MVSFRTRAALPLRTVICLACILLTFEKFANADVCEDTEGGEHQKGERWISGQRFIYTCEISASKALSRITHCLTWWFQEIPVGSFLVFGRKNFTCNEQAGEKFENGN
ncbi:hypothetical protein Q1695_009165 [Nippostrongylus brasiliensis]|nr:hypothetical protein Q1695_009165 [Nippostrongylus brasiliensis]